MITYYLANHYEIPRQYGHGQDLVSLDFSNLFCTCCSTVQNFLFLPNLLTCGVQWQTPIGILLIGTYSRE